MAANLAAPLLPRSCVDSGQVQVGWLVGWLVGIVHILRKHMFGLLTTYLFTLVTEFSVLHVRMEKIVFL